MNVKVANAFDFHLISGTGNTVIEAVKVLIEHGVQPSVTSPGNKFPPPPPHNLPSLSSATNAATPSIQGTRVILIG